MADNKEAPLYYQDLNRGRVNLAPPRALSSPDSPAIFRDSMNFIPRNGLMQRRPGLSTMSSSAKALPPSVFDLTATTNGERPVWVYSTSTSIPKTQVNLTGGINNLIPYKAFPLSAAQTVSFVITNRSAYLYNEALGAWLNVTPTYTTGTIAVTNGSATVTGTGTAWSTRGISPFQHIKISGTWYQIYQVNSDTQIVLSQNFAGTTASGLAYEIKRTWGMGNSLGADRSSAIYATAYNDTIVFAGALLGRADGIVTPTVIQVSGITSASPSTTYLTSSFALVAGLDTVAMNNISGVAVLPDSRVVVSGDSSTVYYSSNLTNVVWSVTPAGFSVVEHKSGAIHSMDWLSSNLCLHYDTGIVFAVPTGQSDPPLAFQDSNATVGCVVPKTLKEIDRTQVFMAIDGNMYVFDGAGTHPIGDDIREIFDGSVLETLKCTLFASVNVKYGEYVLWQYNQVTSFSWTLTRDGSWWPSFYPVPIGAMSDLDALSGTRSYGIAGIFSYDSNASTEVNMLYPILPGVVTDQVLYSGQNSGGHFLEFDDSEWLGMVEESALRYKSAISIVVWFRATQGATENFYVQASRDGGATWTDSSHKAVVAATTGEKPVQFSFMDLISAAMILRFRIVSESQNTLSIAPTRMQITVVPGGDAGLVEL